MTNSQSQRSNQTAASDTSVRIKNTFSNATNEYFTPATLFAACKHGLSTDVLPPEAKKMLREYQIKYNKKCTSTGDPVNIPDLPDDIEFKI